MINRYFLFSLLALLSFGSQSQQLIRRNVKTYTQAQKDSLVNALLLMKTRPSLFDNSINAYDYFAKIHWEALNPELVMSEQRARQSTSGNDQVHVAHSSPGFFVWHREFLRRAEAELRKSTNNPNYTLPYWDWTDPEANSIVFNNNFMGGNGSVLQNFELQGSAFGKTNGKFLVKYQPGFDNPLAVLGDTSMYLQRAFGLAGASLPTVAEIDTAFNIPTYDTYPWNAEIKPEVQSFRQYVEGFRPVEGISPTKIGNKMHGRVHIYVNGNLVSDASPNDPLFFLHHANVDRLHAEWQDRWGIYNFPQTWEDTTHKMTHTWDEMMHPFEVSFKDMLNIRSTGIRYDTQSATENTATEVVLNNDGKGVSINKDNSASNSSAILDIKADNLGILIPRIASKNRPPLPATGLLIYQTDNTPGFYYFDGSVWQRLNATTATTTVVTLPNAIPSLTQQPKMGRSQLKNGRAMIHFERIEGILPENLIITIQIEGECEGVYVTSKTNHGFEVVELRGGTSNVWFGWEAKTLNTLPNK
jgi:tyrosinase